MRLYPKEIEADLLFRGIDINDWHQQRMSSRRLLVLIGALEQDPDSSFSRERRDQDWSLREYMEAALVNELRRLRADQAAIHAGQKMDVDPVQSPAQTQEEESFAGKFKDARNHIMSQLRGEKTK